MSEADGTPRPSEEEFARLLVVTLTGAGETRPIEYDPQLFALKIGEAGELCFNLSNVYEEFCAAAPERQREMLLRVPGFVPNEPRIPDDYSQVAGLLLPRVRERIFYELHALRERLEGSGGKFGFELISPDLACGICLDLPQSVVEFGLERFVSWGVTFEEALEQARENLKQRSEEAFHSPASGFFVSPWQDSHDASRLVLPEIFRSMQLKGEPVAMVPNRDVLLVAGSEDPEALLSLAAVAYQVLQEPRAMSTSALILKEDGWTPWRPTSPQRIAEPFRRLRLMGEARDYAEQKSLLEKRDRRQGIRTRVEEFQVAEPAGEAPVSFCIWEHGGVRLLPRTEQVMFIDGAGVTLGCALWEDVERFLGSHWQASDAYPLRMKAESFPSEEFLREIVTLPPLSE